MYIILHFIIYLFIKNGKGLIYNKLSKYIPNNNKNSNKHLE